MVKLPQLIAHRGAKTLAPENTLIAFELAKQQGVTWVEFDVMLTKDNVPVIFHDNKLNRTTNGKGYVWQHTWEELSLLDAGNWFHASFANTAIPALENTLDLLVKIGLNANIEIKDTGDRDRNLRAAEVAEPFIAKFNQSNQCIVSSLCMESSKLITKILPDVPIGMLLKVKGWEKDFEQHKQDIQALFQQLKCISLHINDKILTQERVAELKSFAPQIAVFTVNSKQRAEQLFNWGVTAIFSDDVHVI